MIVLSYCIESACQNEWIQSIQVSTSVIIIALNLISYVVQIQYYMYINVIYILKGYIISYCSTANVMNSLVCSKINTV